MLKTILVIGVILFLIPIMTLSQNWRKVNVLNNLYYIGCLYEDTVDNVLYIGCFYYNSPIGIYKWDGQNLTHLNGTNFCRVNTIIKYKGILYAGGYFYDTITHKTKYIAKWNGTNWDSLTSGVNYNINNFEIINDELYAMGPFSKAGSHLVNCLAKWDGNQWSNVYAFPDLQYNTIVDVAMYKGELYVCGNFSKGDTIDDIIKYDGNNWVSVGGSMYGGMSGLDKIVVYKNELYAAGLFYKQDGNAGNFIQRWDGVQWKDVGGSVLGTDQMLSDNGHIWDMKVHDSELYVCGVFEYAGGIPAKYIAKWNGTEWCSLGGDFNMWLSKIGFYKDTLYVIGGFSKVDNDSINHLAKWFGGAYTDTCGVDNSGIGDNELQKENISIYPSPANSFINVEAEIKEKGDLVISIYNSLGVKVYESVEKNKTGSFSKQLNISSLSSGLYILNISSAGGRYSKRIVKM